MWAAQSQGADFVKFLLDRGADIHKQDENGRASQNKNQLKCKAEKPDATCWFYWKKRYILLRSGALTIQVVTRIYFLNYFSSGRTALDHAEGMLNSPVVQLLREQERKNPAVDDKH